MVWNGVTITAGTLGADGVREYLVLGDFNVSSGDYITADIGTLAGVRFVVGNDANIASGAVFDFQRATGQGAQVVAQVEAPVLEAWDKARADPVVMVVLVAAVGRQAPGGRRRILR